MSTNGEATNKQYEYNDGVTKQAFADETNINKIIARWAKTGTLSHMAKWKPQYLDLSDFAGLDFHQAQEKIARAQRMFEELPAEIRREFHQSPAAFLAYVNDPANSERLGELLPGLAKPGTQLPAARRTAAVVAAEEAAGAIGNGTAAIPEPPVK